MKKTIFYIEVTDTFGGEANYCWVKRFAVRAATERGAMRVVGREMGYGFRNDGLLWHAVGACVAAYDADPDCYMPAEESKRFVPLNF